MDNMICMKATICLSDIPKAYIREGADGKKYLDLYIGQRRQAKPGKTHYLKVDVPRSYDAAYVGDARLLNIAGNPYPAGGRKSDSDI